MSRIDPANFDLGEWADRAYRRWRLRETAKDDGGQSRHDKLIIENGDPETEAAVAALEQGWLGRG